MNQKAFLLFYLFSVDVEREFWYHEGALKSLAFGAFQTHRKAA